MFEKEHFELVAADYNLRASRGLWGWLKSKEISAVLREVGTAVRILDMGCGSGIYAEKICAKAPNSKIVGLDKSQAMIRQFESRGFTGTCINLEKTGFSGGTFDLILALGVLEFITDLNFFRETVKRSATSGTRVVLLVPRYNLLNGFYFLYHHFQGNKVRIRRSGEYERILIKDGFKFETSVELTPVSRLLVFLKS